MIEGKIIKHWSFLYDIAFSLNIIGEDEEDIVKIIERLISDENFIFVNNKNEEIEIDAETIVYFTHEHNSDIYDKQEMIE